MNYKHIKVAVSGLIGSQIGYQTAHKGFCRNVFDISSDAGRHAR
jgi:hypothetical protein